MKEGQPQAVYLKDYTPPNYFIDQVHLDFQLGEEATIVTSRMQLRRNPDYSVDSSSLELHGEELTLIYVELDGVKLPAEQYSQTTESLLIANVPQQFSLAIQTKITPQTNIWKNGMAAWAPANSVLPQLFADVPSTP